MQRRVKFWIGLVVAALLATGVWFGIQLYADTTTVPIQYEAEINAAADEFHLDRALLYALILSESHFNASVVSPVGAVGLAQLMPGTAAGVAKRIGIANFTTADLYKPAINARLGAAYLRGLLDQYGQDPKLALMGYNGGPGAANRYLTNGTLPAETNRYYKVVLGYQQKYAALFAARDAAAKAAQAAAPTGIQAVFENWFGH